MRKVLVAVLLATAAPIAAQQLPAVAIDETLAPYASAAGAVEVAPGRRINLFCTGAKPSRGTPTVILTGGAGATAASWRKVQPAIAARTRVCAWDRAGFGLSDPSAAPQTASETASDLARALAAARVSGPYLLVGHSIGAYETLRFADTHRRNLAGIVLVDPSIPDQFALFLQVSPTTERSDQADLAADVVSLRRCAVAVRVGALGSDSKCLRGNPAAPPALAAAIARRQRDPARFETAASFFASMAASSAAIVDPARRYGAIPIIVLTARFDPLPAEASAAAMAEQPAGFRLWNGAHDAYAALSTNGVNRIVERTGHMIPQERPDAIIAAIGEMLDQVRGR